MGRFISLIVVTFLVLLVLNGVSAVLPLSETTIDDFAPTTYMRGMSYHPGEICVSCHTRFSKDQPYAAELPFNVSNNAVLHIFPCSKPACHNTPPTRFAPTGTARWTLHLNICENCHPKWNSSYDTIHNTHLNFSYLLLNRSGVECDICHAKPQGYSSKVASVPPVPNGKTEFTGAVIRPDWRGDCSYCHPTIKGALRVHDVHKPVLLNACPICHSAYILQSPAMFRRIDAPYPFEKETPQTIEDTIISIVETNESIIKKPDETRPPIVPVLSEFYLYFDGILEKLLEIYRLVV